MNDLAWTIALLAPRDLLGSSPTSPAELTAPGLLSLLLTDRRADFEEAWGSDDLRQVVKVDPVGIDMVYATRTASDAEAMADGAELLDRLATGGPARRPALRVAAATIASAGFARLDRATESVRVLERVAARWLGGDPTMAHLLSAVLELNLALRAVDQGGDPARLARSASFRLAAVDVQSLPAVPEVTKPRDSTAVFAGILGRLRAACDAHLAVASGDPETASTSADPRADDVVGLFDLLTGEGSSSHVDAAIGPDDDLASELSVAEVSGSLAALALRGLLGRSRFVAGWATKEDRLLGDGLRLLRHAHDAAGLSSALTFLARNAREDVIRAEAMHVVQNRVAGHPLDELEHVVVAALTHPARTSP